MITPFQQNGEIDLDALKRLINFYLAAGVKGFFANCASSEMYHLSEDERLTLALAIRDLNRRDFVAEALLELRDCGVDHVVQRPIEHFVSGSHR